MLWNELTPLTLLLAVAALSLAAAVAARLLRGSRQRQISSLARSWGMHYSAGDIFNLAPRLASRLPVVGASDVIVRDLIYGAEPGGHRYYLCAEYTIGVTRAKARRSCVLSILEPRRATDPDVWQSLHFAPENLPLVDQYQSLRSSSAQKDAER